MQDNYKVVGKRDDCWNEIINECAGVKGEGPRGKLHQNGVKYIYNRIILGN